jgi:ankyrin
MDPMRPGSLGQSPQAYLKATDPFNTPMDDPSDEDSLEDVLLALMDRIQKEDSNKADRLLGAFVLHNRPDFSATNKAGLTCPHIAAESESVTLLELLLERGADPNASSPEKSVEPPLHIAVRAGRVKNVELLLKYKADADRTNAMGRTALHIAAESESATVLELLLERGAHPNTPRPDKSVQPLLHIATRAGRVKNVELLLEHGANIDTADDLGRTALHVAAESESATVLELLLTEGADPNASSPDKSMEPPLHIAARAGRDKSVKMLLEHGADINTVHASGRTALHAATVNDRSSTIQVLIKNKARVDQQDDEGMTALCLAAAETRASKPKKSIYTTATMETLIQGGADLEKPDRCGWTPLHHASMSKAKIATLFVITLLFHGADVNVKTAKEGWTALHNASECGRAETVEALFEAEANIDEQNEEGSTALQLAAMSASGSSRVRALLNYRADVNIKDGIGRTAMHYAVELGSEITLKLILGSGAGVNEQDHEGLTALHLACESISDISKVHILTSHGANADIKDKAGRTALYCAASAENEPAVRSLLHYGASAVIGSNRHGESAYLRIKKIISESLGDFDRSGESQERRWLHEQVVMGDIERVRRYLEAEEFDVNTPDSHGQTLLHMAVNTKFVPMIVLLIEKGADMEALSHQGKTPFDLAFENKAIPVMLKMVSLSL